MLVVLDALDDELVVDLCYVRVREFPGGHEDGSTHEVLVEEALDEEEMLVVLSIKSLGSNGSKQ